MAELAPVLTGCHVCRSPLVDLINRRMAQGVSDTDISSWLKQEGHYVSRITLGKHKREHLTNEHETARIQAAQVLKKQQGTIKFKGDLAGLIRDQVMALVDAGQLTPTLAEGLRAQEIIDRRQEKHSDRELTLALAGILGGSALVEGTAVSVEGDEGVPGDQLLSVSGEIFSVSDSGRVLAMATGAADRSEGNASAQDSGTVN